MLFRELGLVPSTALVIGNIIGIGIFTTSGIIAEQIGSSFWLIGVWLIGGAIALIGALCYAHLGSQYPRAGGEYAFLYPSYGPFSAFLSGWASLLIGFTAPIAASALGLVYYTAPYLPTSVTEGGTATKSLAILAILIVSVLLSIGLRTGTRLHSIVTLMNIVLVVIFSVAVLSNGSPRDYLIPVLADPGRGVSVGHLASAIILVMFTYSGWNAAAYIAEEIKSPARNLPAALMIGTAIVVVLYLLINFAYLSAGPLDQIVGKVAVAEVTARGVLGPSGTNLVNLLILFSILSSLSAMSIAGPRVYYAMSRDGLFPKWLSQVDPERKVPTRAIWFQSAIAVVFVLLGDFRQILLYSGFVLLLFSTWTVSALWRVSKRRFLPGVFILINVVVLVNAVWANPAETVAGLATVACGIPVYFFFKRRRTGN